MITKSNNDDNEFDNILQEINKSEKMLDDKINEDDDNEKDKLYIDIHFKDDDDNRKNFKEKESKLKNIAIKNSEKETVKEINSILENKNVEKDKENSLSVAEIYEDNNLNVYVIDKFKDILKQKFIENKS